MATLGTRLDFPLWVPYADGSRGFHTWSNARAIAAGLAFRPLDATVADTLAWWRSLPAERVAKLRAGLSAEQEAEVLAKLA
jgi:2'-hydroxyisoflavone reductase